MFVVWCLSVQAQYREQAFVHTDKSSYLAGEDIWVKLYVVDETSNKPTLLSKVGYVELCNTERSHVQLKIALNDGTGWGKVRIPMTVPTGIYRLTGYTRYMRNGGEDVFFKKTIAIVNTFNSSEADRLELVETRTANPIPEKKEIGLQVISDKKEYGNRSKVQLLLNNLPREAKDITVSVFRDDDFVHLPIGYEVGKKGVSYSEQWIPEYEGHIVTAKIVGKEAKKEQSDAIHAARIAFVGKDFCLTGGQMRTDDTVWFYTNGIYGPQETVVWGTSLLNKPIRLDLSSAFSENLPKELPLLQLYPDKQALQERSIGVQLQQISVQDSIGYHVLPEKFYNFTPVLSYNLDEYTRFATLRETFIEFIWRIHLSKINDETIMQVMHIDTKRYSAGKALVLLDGVPINNHGSVLNYNPYLLQRIDIFDGKYMFGGELFDSMISFVSKAGRLSGIHLGDESQLVNYDFPHQKDVFPMPDYAIPSKGEELRKPDFRHTLYWNPDVKPDTKDLTFYTSDLSGRFRIVVEAVTTDGKIISGSNTFEVRE